MRYFVILAVSIFIMFPAVGFSDTINIPADYSTIQKGIDAAVKGDTVLVAPGTYVENIDFNGKAITVASSKGAKVTVIDGGSPINPDFGSVVKFESGEGSSSVLAGFTLTNGTGTYIEWSPGNVIYLGGGIYCNGASPLIINNIIKNNDVEAHPENGSGGGLFCFKSSLVLANSTIANNHAKDGAGLHSYFCSLTLNNNFFINNYADGDAGGIHCDQSTDIYLSNTLLGNNSNLGGGIWCYYASPTLTNMIFWNNQANQGNEIAIGWGSLTISYSDVKGGLNNVHLENGGSINWGSGMINTNPLFVNEVIGDLHLTFPSPCKDTGDNTAVIELIDFEGDPRIAYGTVDMGADEFYTHLYWTGDATPGGNVEMKFVGLPGTKPVQLWLGLGVLDPPWPTKYGDWYLEFPLLADVMLGTIPTDGVLVFPFTFPANTPTPLTLPFQSGIGMELTNLSVMEVE